MFSKAFISALISYTSEDGAVQRATALPYGLGASVWPASQERARTFASELNSGMVWINQHLQVDSDIPFGGIGQSGSGSELGREGLEAFTQVKVISARR